MDLEILRIASDTSNNKNLDPHTHFSESKNPICGDVIQIKLIAKGSKVSDFAYQGKSCVYCQATASVLSNKLLNYKTLKINELCDYANVYFSENHENLKKEWKFLNKLLTQKNVSRQQCILLPFNALKKIVSTL